MLQAEKRPYHHGDLREALILAGEQALSDLPLDEVSLREIARRAGVSHAAPKHHFGSLGVLFAEIAARGFEHFVAALDAAADHNPDQSATARMTAMARAYVRFAVENPAVYGLMFGKRDTLDPTPHLTTAMFAAWEQLERQVTAVIGPQNARYGAMLVWSAVHGMAMLRLDRKMPPHVEPDAAISQMIRMVIAGLEAEA